MKQIMKKILATVLAFSSLLALFGCDKNETETPTGGTQQDEVLFAGFEAWLPDFQMCRISNYFGKVSLNSDKQYVTEGEHSARIDPVGNGWMYFSTYSERFQYDYTDFTRLDCIRMEMYNPQATEEKVTVGLVSEPYALDQFNRAGGKEFTLKPGWNTLNYYIEPMLVSVIADLADIRGIYMIFDPLFLYEITDETPRYYLDNIRFRYKETAHKVENSFEFGENEIMNFEKFYESNFYMNDFAIDMKMVKPGEYGVPTSSGAKALRIVFPGTASGTWKNYFQIMGAYMKKSPLGNLTNDQFNNAYFCWDVYNASSSTYNLVAAFYDETGKNNYKLATYPVPGEWTKFRVKLTDIVEKMPSWREKIGNFSLDVMDNLNKDREIFVDNIHLEFDNNN